MARRKRGSPVRILIVAAAIAAIAATLWYGRDRLLMRGQGPDTAAAVSASADRIDPANDGRSVRVAGTLEFAKGARDAQLGIATDAAVLLRKVEMFQWQERCSGDDCSYEAAWTEHAIDSHGFRHPAGHENPPERFADARFFASDIKLGAYAVAGELAAAQLKPIDFPVHAASLPPNLAASFAESGGALFAGGDAEHPQVGTVKVSYRIVATGTVSLVGVQHGARLDAR